MKIRSSFLVVPALFVTLCACDDETTLDQNPAIVSFPTTELAIAENDGSRVITLPLSKTFKQQGEIVVDVSSVTNGFELEPAAINGQLNLPVTLQQDVVTFSLTPKDNSVINDGGDETIIFKVSSVSEGLVIGENKSLRVIITDDEVPAAANFSAAGESIRENNNEGVPVVISLSHAAPGAGTVTIALESNDVIYGNDYTTVPEAVNGKISLSIENGADHVSFKVLPQNDNLFNGNRNISMKLESAEGAVSRGQASTHAFKITDDELATKAKGYTTGGGSWSYKKEYSYNLDGSVAQIRWQQATPGVISGVYTYHYDDSGKLIKSIDNPVQETRFTWEGDQITKSERVKNGALVEYTLFGYDDAGNVGEVTQYNKQDDGNFVMSMMFVYLYHNDGNVYKRLAYYPGEGEDNFTLISTQTYEDYLDVENPFTMLEILPNKKTQLTLPRTYRLEQNDVDLTYNLSYVFDAQGRPTSRTATSGTTREITNYQYFD
jgi:YD repeat-containing protein